MAGNAEQPLWTPPAARQQASQMRRFVHGAGFVDYQSAWEWSVAPATMGDFWARVSDTFAVPWRSAPVAALEADPEAVTGARWFPGGRLNYAEMALQAFDRRPYDLAVISRSDTRGDLELTWADLRSLVARARAGLLAAGVQAGDVVAGYLPNIPEALAVLLAAASLGATWTCCAPEMGVSGCLDRLAQTRPVVLVAVDGYRYGTRVLDRSEEADAVRAGLPTLRRAVRLRYLDPDRPAPAGWTEWDDFLGPSGADLDFLPVAFDHPLYVLYSSGTTGQPKAIVHGHGGIALEHAKALGLHFDIGERDRFFWYTTTGWMMWNFCVSGLLVGATVVLFDGDPAGDRLWALMADLAVTVGGVGAGYLVAGAKAGLRPGTDHDLSALKTLGATGSPLPASAAQWVYEAVAGDVMLSSFSGGTDVCTGFVGTSPLHPVWGGEISCRCLGARVEVFDDDGRPVIGSEGELVVTAPLPSMPVGIVDDPAGARYRETYFERFPGVWAHGDRALISDRGTVVITGRSDGTLNRGGVRMGTAEFYSVVEGLDEVADSLVVHLEDPEGGPGRLVLFVVPAAGPVDETAGRVDEAALRDRIGAVLRRDLSPRHVPDAVHVIAAVPRTLSGKKLEVPVKRILSGVAPERAVAVSAVADPESLEPFVQLAADGSGLST